MFNRRPDIDNIFLPDYIDSVKNHPYCLKNPKTVGTLVSGIIIIDCMGPDFVARNFDGRIGGEGYVREDFYKKVDGMDTLLFANALWETRNCAGWKNFVIGNRDRNPRALYAEMQFAFLLMKGGADVEFVKPRSRRGFDFDLRCTGHNVYGNIDIEVKNRGRMFRSVDYFKEYLSNFRDQIAGEGNKALLINLDCKTFSQKSQELIDKGIQDTLKEWKDYSFIAYTYTAMKVLEDGKRTSLILFGGLDRNGNKPQICPKGNMLDLTYSRGFYD